METRSAQSKCGWRIPEWGDNVGVKKSKTYELMAAGEIDSVKVGGARVITTSPREFLERAKAKAAA